MGTTDTTFILKEIFTEIPTVRTLILNIIFKCCFAEDQNTARAFCSCIAQFWPYIHPFVQT